MKGEDGGLDGGDEDPPDVEDEDAGTEDTPDTGTDTAPTGDDAGADTGAMSCEPLGCREQGFNCGMADDKCGGPLKCGNDKCESTSTVYDTCGGGGKPNVCGCTPYTCESLSKERAATVCGTIDDGCGGKIECGNSCTGTDTCSGGAAGNQCGCTPNPDPCAGKACGTADDGCGHTVQCGSNAGMCSANKECTANACVCKTDLSSFCTGKCGPQQTPDGCTVDCGNTGSCAQCAPGNGVSCASCLCPGSEVCLSNATCCVPEAPATLCGSAQCGTRTNSCGQQVNCGTCGAGLACTADARCESPTAAALIGKYAVRSVGFGVAAGLVTRAEGILLVDIYRDNAGKIMMREQPCFSAGYTKNGNSENTITTVSTEISSRAIATNIELDLTGASSVNGAKDWLRPVQPNSQNVAGWRRGRPSYCPANGGPPDASHPDYHPTNDPRSIGAIKPWLSAPCLCPAQEFAVSGRAPCKDLTGARLTACMADPENLSLPYSSGGNAKPESVTDCRVVDDDLDGKPGNTASVTATVLFITASATIGSASVTANQFWGTIDTTAAKRHWGVSQDQVGLQSANVTCDGSSVLCGTSSGNFCPAYTGAPYGKDQRRNPIEFVSLHDKTPPTGGWAAPGESVAASCAEIYARRNDTGWFTNVQWPTRYPAPDACNIAGQ